MLAPWTLLSEKQPCTIWINVSLKSNRNCQYSHNIRRHVKTICILYGCTLFSNLLWCHTDIKAPDFMGHTFVKSKAYLGQHQRNHQNSILLAYVFLESHCQIPYTKSQWCRKCVHVLISSCVLTVYPKKHAHGFVVLCFVVVMQSFIMNSHEAFVHIHQGCFAGTGAIVRLPQCQWNKPDGYGKISQCITTTKHSKAKTVCIFLGIYCTAWMLQPRAWRY